MTSEKRISAERHKRTRRDHATETAEDYVESIDGIIAEQGACRVVDLTGRFGVTHVTVIKTLNRLQREGLVVTAPQSPITLTAAGRRLARKCRDRHETVYAFLRAIGVSAKVAAIDAEGIEHHVSPETLRCFRRVAKTGGGK